MKGLLVIIFLWQAITLFGQTPNWKWTRTGKGADCAHATSVTSDSMGNIYVVGNYEGGLFLNSTSGGTSLTNPSTINYNVFLTKYDTTGKLIWAKRIGTDYYTSYGEDIKYRNGYIYITGAFREQIAFGTITLTTPANIMNVFVAKYTTTGAIVWAKKYGGDYGGGIATGMFVNNNDEIAITGLCFGTFIYGNDTIICQSYDDIFTMMLDSSGNGKWVRGVGGSGSDYGYGIGIDNNSNVYVTGFFQNKVMFDTVLMSATNRDMFIAKYDSVGKIIWAKQFGGWWDDAGTWLNINNDRLYVSGEFSGVTSFDTISLTAQGQTDGFISSMNLDGEVKWVKQIGGGGVPAAQYNCIMDFDISPAGTIFFAGYFIDTVFLNSGYLVSRGATDILAGEMDTSGNILWAKRAGSTYHDYGITAHRNIQNSFFISGSYGGYSDFGSFNVSNSGCDDVFISKLSSSSVGINEQEYFLKTVIYPNPFLYSVAFDLSDSKFESNSANELILYDLVGCEVKRILFKTKKFEIQRENLPSGIYFYKITSENKIIGTGKIVAQ